MPDVEELSLIFVSDHAVWISWQHADQRHAPPLKRINDVLASYVTAGARIHLYSYLNRLEEKALYCDTDSVVYVEPRVELGLVETGECLGAMTSELKPGHHICEFVGAGPKSYAYKTFNSVTDEHTTVCKVRGITLIYKASQLINFEKIREMILNKDDKETVTVRSEKKIKRKRDEGGVYAVTELEYKIYRISF